MLRYYQWDFRNNIQFDFQSRKCIWKCRMRYKILAFIFDFSVTRGKIFFRFISSNLENSTRAIACYASCNNMTIETIVGTYYLIRKVKNMCTTTEGRPSRSCSHERGGGRWTIFGSVAALEQTPFSSAFTCEKIIVFWSNSHMGRFPWVQFKEFNIGPGISLVTKQTTTRLDSWWPNALTHICLSRPQWVTDLLIKSFPPGQNGRHFADDIFRCNSVNEKFIFWLKFHWSLFLSVQLTISQHWSDNGLAPNRRQAIIWTNADRFSDAYMRHLGEMS